ncbi:hypothetical protein [Paenibacillus sp. S150]|uniref:MGH1-like glycoside hydrolase domain-containing protein n=1 Tax=Paenibacillus sp. S150 TaxID=2749826 RepID=UPI001C59ACF0|nr:hypothetical protein [Paenibacillus sp. S150]MBW4081550.1 hypothetical protein [Paenibacillus sp. S150]
MAYELQEFALDLRKSTAPPNYIAVNSGYATVAPRADTVMGVQGCWSPPFAAGDAALQVQIVAEGHLIEDTGNMGKGDCGLLLAGSEWRPDRLARTGTYHYFVHGQLLSLAVQSELSPFADRPGFMLGVSVRNRTNRKLEVALNPVLAPGCPGFVPLDQWDFGFPPKGEPAGYAEEAVWENGKVRLSLLADTGAGFELEPDQERTVHFGVILSRPGEAVHRSGASPAKWGKSAASFWQERLEEAGRQIPTLRSDIPGLENYYRRALLSGLVCLWYKPEFAIRPFPAVAGMEGAGICAYPWDTGGYAAQTLNLLFGKEKSIELLRLMVDSGIDRHSRFAPDGTGLDGAYSYSLWSFYNLAWCAMKQHGIIAELFPVMRDLLLKDEERLPHWGELLDYGDQRNLLEMRSAAHQHVVSSPNAERAWCYDRLADLAAGLGLEGAAEWRGQAERIRAAIRAQLWDAGKGWFKCIYPSGHVEYVYTIQAYDSLRMGVCTPEMEADLLSHLREGAFLGEYGISSISAEDELHYELNDPDWSGGGSYTGEGPVLAQTLWEIGQPGLAWDVLQRLFWMGALLPYFPQEHYSDRPMAPSHKRANIIAGLAGVEAVLFGLAGFEPQLNGELWVSPQPPEQGSITITGYPHRNLRVDVRLSPGACEIVCDGQTVYRGEPKRVLVCQADRIER